MYRTPKYVVSTTILCFVPGEDISAGYKHCITAVVSYTCFQLKATRMLHIVVY